MGESKRTRRQFSSEDKAKVVKRHVLDGEAVSAICEDLDIAPNLFYRWQKELFDHADAAFEVKGRGRGANGGEQSTRIGFVVDTPIWIVDWEVPRRASSDGQFSANLYTTKDNRLIRSFVESDLNHNSFFVLQTEGNYYLDVSAPIGCVIDIVEIELVPILRREIRMRNSNGSQPSGVQPSANQSAKGDDAIRVVAAHIGSNKLGVRASDLLSMPNPKGGGTFVYVQKTRYFGVERYVIWMVVENRAYALNGPTKGVVTPNLPWPREAPEGIWARTRLSPYSTTEAIEIVFGK